MNMAKLGTVSAAMRHSVKTTKPNRIKAFEVTPYTACVLQNMQRQYCMMNNFIFLPSRH
jgi:hypothetical protein